MKRGDIWEYQPILAGRPGRDTDTGLRLIVSADSLNIDSDVPIVLVLTIVNRDPGSLLGVRVDTHGWARATSSAPIAKTRLTTHVSTIDSETLDQVDIALRAAYSL